ncbi:MAG: hypothetical protein HFI19_04275 [Lachnospiraceae bacterium]|jgi:L-fucose isomerase-like protein|nr:hypothetical protein [Lachnospiraceae bacterium]
METVKIGFVPSTWESWDGNAYTGKLAEKTRDRCMKVFDEVPGLEIVVPSKELTDQGCVGTVEEGMATADLFLKENVQGIIIGNMNFGLEIALGALLSKLPKDMPVLHFATRSGPFSSQGNRSTDTWCGQFMTCSALRRRGFKFEHIITCEPEESRFAEKVETFTRACNAVSHFKGARVLQVGTRPTKFESQFFSEEDMMRNFSQVLVPVDLATAYEYMDAISADDPDVLRIAEEIRWGADLITLETPNSITNQARFEKTLITLAEEHHCRIIASSCWESLQHRYSIAACSTFSRLNSQGYSVGCEVDVMGAVTMSIMNHCALGTIPADFIDWTDLHPTEENVWLAWHCGNAACELCAGDCQKHLTMNERLGLWSPTCYGSMEFRMKNGPVTCARLVEYDGKYSMFFGTGEIVDIGPETRGSYGWVKVNDIEDWEQKMIDTGIIHHGALIHDDKVADALEMFCKFMDIEAVRGK